MGKLELASAKGNIAFFERPVKNIKQKWSNIV